MRTLTFLLVLFFSIPLIYAQHFDFSRTYKGPGYDDARSIAATDDGAFVITGLNKSADDTLGDMYLTKINAAGAILWERFYGLPKEDGGNFLMKTLDGGFLISGHTAYNYGSSCNGYIVKTDSEGQELWRQFIGTAYDDVCNGAVQTEDGNYYFTGRVEDGANDKFDLMLCKIEEDGSYGFLKTYGNAMDDIGYKITQATDGHLLIAGYSIHEETEKECFYVIKTDLDGNLMWEYRDNNPAFNTRAYGILASENGGCVIAGGMSLNKKLVNYDCAFIARLDKNGKLEVLQPILQNGLKSYGFDLCNSGDQHFAITGVLKNADSPFDQSAVWLLNKDFGLIDYKFNSYAGMNKALSIVPVGDYDFLIAGKSKEDAENTDISISRVNFLSTSTYKIELLPFYLFPNPMSDFTYLKLENSPHDKILNLYNTNGELVKTIDFKGSEVFLYKEDLLAGVYFFRVGDQKGQIISTGKLMVK